MLGYSQDPLPNSDLLLPQTPGERQSTAPASVQIQEMYHQLPQYDKSKASSSMFQTETPPTTSNEEQVSRHGTNDATSSTSFITAQPNASSEAQQTKKIPKTRLSYTRTCIACGYCRTRKVSILKSIVYARWCSPCSDSLFRFAVIETSCSPMTDVRTVSSFVKTAFLHQLVLGRGKKH